VDSCALILSSHCYVVLLLCLSLLDIWIWWFLNCLKMTSMSYRCIVCSALHTISLWMLRPCNIWCPMWAREHCRISPPRFLAECCKRQLNQGSFVLLYFRLSTFLICIEFVYLYFPVLFCLSISVKWLAVKTASEMTYIVSSGALSSTPTNQPCNIWQVFTEKSLKLEVFSLLMFFIKCILVDYL